jgi:hypothetical protein
LAPKHEPLNDREARTSHSIVQPQNRYLNRRDSAGIEGANAGKAKENQGKVGARYENWQSGERPQQGDFRRPSDLCRFGAAGP